MNKLERISELIQSCEDKKLLRLLNNLWWREWFRLGLPVP